MLAKPTKGLSEVLDRFSNCAFTCEYKYDGERAQIHMMADGSVHVFSRNSEDNSTKYPDIAALMPRAAKAGVTSAILDAEAVAVDAKTGAIQPFQVLSTRKRKDVGSADEVTVKVCVYAFDLLYLNGESYLQRPLSARREALHNSFEVLPHEFQFAVSSDAADVEELQGCALLRGSIRRPIRRPPPPAFGRRRGGDGAGTGRRWDGDGVGTGCEWGGGGLGTARFPCHLRLPLLAAKPSARLAVPAIPTAVLEASIKGNCEGLMVKTLDVDATYEPSRRSLNWLKVKKDYLQGMTDSCDLVPIGAYFGKGKRTGVYGAYLIACYNPDDESYESVCKIGTGFNDAALESLHAALSEKTIDAPRAYYRTPDWAANQMPDVWFEPCQVWEVLAADLSISPVHMAAAGLVDSQKGIALRFPRYLRTRDDKGVEDATSSEQIAQMYQDQACTQSRPAADDDFD